MTRNIWLEVVRSGCICVSLCLAWPLAATAEPFRNALDAPPAWAEYAKRLKSACETALQADTPTARHLNIALEKLRTAAKPDDPPMRVKVRLWIASNGTIDRVSIPAPPSDQVTSDLDALLHVVSAGAPPADMLQPVGLLLSLTPRK